MHKDAMATPIQIIPLQLAGNTTTDQNQQLADLLRDTAAEVSQLAVDQLDRQSAQTILDKSSVLKSEFVDALMHLIERHTISDKYKDEEVPSKRVYSPSYRVRPIEAQVTELRKHFPLLKNVNEKLARRPLPDGAEAWFAIPNWASMAPTYNEAAEMVIEVLASKRKFQNRLLGKLGPNHLRQTDRNKLAYGILKEQQPGADIFIVAAQFGMKHRGCSARRARVSMFGNEYGGGVLTVGSMLLTHPERLSSDDALMIDCGGDEYAPHSDFTFDRVPLFDYDIAGIEFSIFYNDRARNLWGTPSCFLYRTN